MNFYGINMAYLVRKISIARWPDKEFSKVDPITADAITEDLKTTSNEMSWWKVDSNEDAIDIGVSYFSSLSKKQANIRLVLVPFEKIDKYFMIKNTPEHAITAIPKMKIKHYDVCDLNYKKLGLLAKFVALSTSCKEQNHIVTVNKKYAIEKIKELNQNGEVDNENLGDFMKQYILI